MTSGSSRDLWIASTILKILLYPAYRSTDFEVHRNWLAITSELPLREWYHDTTSQWTLDYPPFFAWFSYALSLPAKLLPTIVSEPLLRLSASPVETWQTVGYMRTTVLITELCLLFGCLSLARRSSGIPALAVFYHPGFLMLDNIHFQYNAFLFGLMLWSFVGAQTNRPLLCAFFFAALLNFKHIYVYQAPAWFVYLFRAYCFPDYRLRIDQLAKVGVVVLAVFAASLGPFLVMGQGSQLLARLFPFSRGLMHAYWAPNVWALVAMTDRVLLRVASRFGFSVVQEGVASASRGLVGDTKFAVLPEITPLHCFLLTAATQVFQLIPLWRQPTYPRFLQAVAACGFSSFMFGWHVHEKAIMLILVPLSLLASQDHYTYKAFMLTSVAGIVSLFPLLFKVAETPVKMGCSLVWLLVVSKTVRSNVHFPPRTIASTAISYLTKVYFLSAIPLLIFTSIVHPMAESKAEFLPLMLTSVWCAIGVGAGWMTLLYAMFRSEDIVRKAR